MFCQSCGGESDKGLRYCKRCGANLDPHKPSTPSKPQGLVWILAFSIAMMMGLPTGGIVLLFGAIPVLLERGLPIYFLMGLEGAGLLIILVATLLLSRLLAPLFKAYLQSGEVSQQTTIELGQSTATQIPSQPESISSVTEQTTRTFEPAYEEHKTK